MYRFLILDEHPASIQMYIDFLQTKECFADLCCDPSDVFSMIADTTYDLILMDTSISDTDCFELCRSICSKSNIPVIFLSANAEESFQIQGFSSGACDYIVKGISPALFWARLYARASSYQYHGDILRKFPPLVLDLQRQRAYIDGTNLRLTQIEFSLLALLSSRPGVIWSVDELYTEIWGTTSTPDPQIIQAHLSRMRRKIEKAYPRHDFIETIWRKGYQFVPVTDA